MPAVRALNLDYLATDQRVYKCTLIRLSRQQRLCFVTQHNVHSVVAASMRTATLISFYTHTTSFFVGKDNKNIRFYTHKYS